MKLTTKKALEVLAGINALDGYEQAVEVGSGEGKSVKIVRVPFRLSGAFRMKMATNKIELTTIQEAQQETRKAIFAELLPEGEDELTGDQAKEFEKKMKDAMEAVHDLDLETYEPKEFELDNQANKTFPVWALAALAPVRAKEKKPKKEKALD